MSSNKSIITAQNVEISFESASLGNRILAYILDSFVKYGYLILVYLIIIEPIITNINSTSSRITLLFITILPYLFYSLVFEYVNNGQTPGKMWMNIRVIALEGEGLTFLQVLIRWAARLIDFNLFSGLVALIAAASTKPHQRVGDIMAGTTVASKGGRISLNDTIYAAKKNVVEEVEAVIYPRVHRLSSKQIELIKETINSTSLNNRTEVIQNLTEKVCVIIDVPLPEKNVPFLKQILRDYTIVQKGMSRY